MGCDGDLEVIWTETYDNTSCPCEYTIYRTFDTSDCAGNPAMDVQTVVVEDTTPPELHNVPADVTYDLVSQIPLLDDALNGVSATDNSGHATKTVIETDNGNGRFTRDFISEDCSGNTATDTQVITIIDVTPPSLPPIDDDTVECDEIPEPCNEYMQPIGETWNVEYAQEREDINDGQTLYRLIRTWPLKTILPTATLSYRPSLWWTRLRRCLLVCLVTRLSSAIARISPSCLLLVPLITATSPSLSSRTSSRST